MLVIESEKARFNDRLGGDATADRYGSKPRAPFLGLINCA